MEPATIIAAATAAYGLLKQGIAAGRQLEDMGGQLADWAGALSDLDFLEARAKDPPFYKSLSGHVQSEAIEIFAARRKARAMRKELRVLIQYQYGLEAWAELIAIEVEIRKKRRAHVYARQKARDQLIEGLLFTGLLLGGIMALVALVYFMTREP